jgi:hypothetical protein
MATGLRHSTVPLNASDDLKGSKGFSCFMKDFLMLLKNRERL